MSGTVPDIQLSSFSRVFLLEGGAGPATIPQYMGYWRAGGLDMDLGDKTRIFTPSNASYGKFAVAAEVRGEPGNPEITLTGRKRFATLSKMLKLARNNCPFDVQLHFGECRDPMIFNSGWETAMILEGADPTNYSTDDLGALEPGENAVVNEMIDVGADDVYEIKRVQYDRQGEAQIVNEIARVIVCDEATCGACGVPSDGCNVILAVAMSSGSSPGLAGELVYSLDGGTTWLDVLISTLTAGNNADDLVCFGDYVVVVSSDDVGWHYALMSDIVASGGLSATWTRVQLGLTVSGAPFRMWTPDSTHLWSLGTSSRVYFSQNLTDDVVIQHTSGDVTAENLNVIHGIDNEQFIVGANNNVILLTRNGGNTFVAVTGPEASANLTAIYMVNANTWWVGTSTGILYYTTNAGLTWHSKGFVGSGTGSVWDIQFSTPSVGWMSAGSTVGTLFRTIDGGNSWVKQPSILGQSMPTATRFNSIAVCADPNVVYAGGVTSSDGILVKGA